jgi:SAM-dependent methyltransferase
MNPFIRGLVRAVTESFPLPGPVLEIGSYQCDGQADLADLRSLFPGRHYTGIDVRPGPGVDEIADVEALPYPDASFGTVLGLETFEHVAHFWRGFAEVRRVLRPDGVLLVSSPFYFHIHPHPSDYWRFTPEAFQLLLDDYPSKIIGTHGPATRPAGVWALACREGRSGITPAEYETYLARMNVYARMPLPWARRLSYRLGSWLCGRRPFAPYLERHNWRSECLNRPARDPFSDASEKRWDETRRVSEASLSGSV